MKIIGIDYGKKKIGIAIGDTKLKTALPLAVFYYQKESEALEFLNKIIKEEKVEEIILGLPLAQNGKETKMSLVAMIFGQKLKEKTGLPLYFENETLSSQTAVFYHETIIDREKEKNKTRKKTKKPKNFDSQAAAIILENYLAKLYHS